MKRAFEVRLRGEEGGGVYVAETPGKARYEALLDYRDVLPDLSLTDLLVRRAPAYDRSRGEWNGFSAEYVAKYLAQEEAVQAWNAAHPTGTPVIVRLDGGGEMHTRTRSAASILCYGAVVWCEGIAGCYALSHVTPDTAGEG